MEVAYRVIIADDDQDFRELVRTFLEEENYEVVEAEDGRRAIEEARRVRPDILLLDIMMPGVDGFNVCRTLKKDSNTAGIPIIFLSVKAALADKLCGYIAGAQRYLPKPFEMKDLHECIQTVLRQKSVTGKQMADQMDEMTDPGIFH